MGQAVSKHIPKKAGNYMFLFVSRVGHCVKYKLQKSSILFGEECTSYWFTHQLSQWFKSLTDKVNQYQYQSINMLYWSICKLHT